jgi:MerR family transcriptional regulator, light-induced transcriptional regulator
VKIGELSRRTGATQDLLRVWERRYGLLRPDRTEGGFRLYSADDERRVREMKDWLAQGIPASVAASLVLRSSPAGDLLSPHRGHGVVIENLRAALDAFDEARANAVLDELLAAFSLRGALDGVLLPYLTELGRRWEIGQASIAQEHFATTLLRGRLLALGRNWGVGAGERHALLACPPGEHHDLGLIAFGLVLHEQGWRITFLGANTPITTMSAAADTLQPTLVVISSLDPSALTGARAELVVLGKRHRLAIAQAVLPQRLMQSANAFSLEGGPVDAAEKLATDYAAPPTSPGGKVAA